MQQSKLFFPDAACKWSNEGCTFDHECCSKSCSSEHPGTEPRCEKSGMLDPCLYNYHCERAQICGPRNKCCSDYWNGCRSADDCCDPAHVCLYARGFVYKKCLYGPVRPKNTGNSSNSSVLMYLYCILHIFTFHFQ